MSMSKKNLSGCVGPRLCKSQIWCSILSADKDWAQPSSMDWTLQKEVTFPHPILQKKKKGTGSPKQS